MQNGSYLKKPGCLKKLEKLHWNEYVGNKSLVKELKTPKQLQVNREKS